MASVFDAISDGYRTGIVDTGREPELLLLLSFLLAFGFIRTSAHLIRAQVRWGDATSPLRSRWSCR